MKSFSRAFVLLFASLLLSASALASDFRLWTGNDKVNPAINTVLVTSGSINEQTPNGAILRIKIVISSTATAGFQLQLRDASQVVVWSLKYGVAANNPSDLLDFEIDVPNNHSLNVVNSAAITGTVHAHILARVTQGY